MVSKRRSPSSGRISSLASFSVLSTPSPRPVSSADGDSAFLKREPAVLWLVRAILLASVVLHIVAAAQLKLLDRAARPKRYARLEPQAATLASRTMRVGGVVIALFIVFHLLHLTTG